MRCHSVSMIVRKFGEVLETTALPKEEIKQPRAFNAWTVCNVSKNRNSFKKETTPRGGSRKSFCVVFEIRNKEKPFKQKENGMI